VKLMTSPLSPSKVSQGGSRKRASIEWVNHLIVVA
jgi:hypothetical protein